MDTITGKTSSMKDGVSRVKPTVGEKLKDVVVKGTSPHISMIHCHQSLRVGMLLLLLMVTRTPGFIPT